jgi:glutamine synthetase type III
MKWRQPNTKSPPFTQNANIAADHQQLIMITLKRVAQKYGMEALHEKPLQASTGRQAFELVARQRHSR